MIRMPKFRTLVVAEGGHIPADFYAVEANILLNRKRQCRTMPFMVSLSVGRALAYRRKKGEQTFQSLKASGTVGTRKTSFLLPVVPSVTCFTSSLLQKGLPGSKLIKANLVVSINAVDLVGRAAAASKSRVPLEESM